MGVLARTWRWMVRCLQRVSPKPGRSRAAPLRKSCSSGSLTDFAHIWALAAGLIALLLIGAVPVRAQDAPPIRVGVVIQGPEGAAQTACVTLSEGATGLDALQATGAEIVLEQGSLGTSVCRVDGIGCTPPGENCFCQCEGGAACAYWAYFYQTAEGQWQYSPLGAQATPVSDGSVQGWWWRVGSQPAQTLPAVTFADICSSPRGFPRTVIDDLGRAVEIPAPPQRIASVTLASDEILLDLVGPERLLGVTFFAADPAISNIADRLDGIARTDLVGNPELLISLEADLVVLSTYSNPAALDQLLSAGVPLVVLGSFGTLDDIRSNIAFLGEVTGEEARADAMIAQMEAALAAVRDAVAGQEPVRVLYYELGGITYGAGSTVDEIIRLAGGVNVAADAELGTYPLINPEFILATDPDVILLGGWFSGDATPRDWFSADPVFASLRAVQSGRVYAIHDAHLTSVSQHFVDGVADVARLLYPDAFSEDPDRAKPAS